MGVDTYFNHDLDTITTPIKVDVFEELLKQTGYDTNKTKNLVSGFRTGFDLGYRGPKIRWNRSRNLPLTVGNKFDLWEKVMKEVKMGRYAGPYTAPPFDNFIQSPIGLVPKAGNRTRLIFHLSYNFSENDRSVNECTPDEFCSVKYKDLEFAIKTCLRLQRLTNSKRIFYSKTDLMSAFRILPLKKDQYCWLLLKAYHPVTGILYLFVEKNLPFGASSSCKLFQEFSDSLRHLIETITHTKWQTTNYLDDFLFVEICEQRCNRLVNSFIQLCKQINCPLSEEKTERASTRMIFLGILLDGENFV